MFALVQNNQFIKLIPENTPFAINNVRYPANFLNLSTPQEKSKLGIVDVVYEQRADDKYYWVSENPPVYANGVVTISYTSIAKDLSAAKEQASNQVRAAAYSLLQPTDYIDIRNLRDPNYKIDWMIWRDQIRVQAKAQAALIDACQTVEELAALPSVDWAKDPDAPVIVEEA